MSTTSRAQAVTGAEARTRAQDAKTGGQHAEEPGLVSRIGALEVDWPRSLGFFGGIAVAVGAGLIEPPLGLFIAAVPFLKMLDLPSLPERARFVAQIFEGVAKPVGGDSEGTVRIVTAKGSSDEPVAGDT